MLKTNVLLAWNDLITFPRAEWLFCSTLVGCLFRALPFLGLTADFLLQEYCICTKRFGPKYFYWPGYHPEGWLGYWREYSKYLLGTSIIDHRIYLIFFKPVSTRERVSSVTVTVIAAVTLARNIWARQHLPSSWHWDRNRLLRVSVHFRVSAKFPKGVYILNALKICVLRFLAAR